MKIKRLLAVSLWLTAFCSTGFAQFESITTIGGENIGNGVTGTSFGVNPYCAVPDNMGNVYIADASNHIVHKLSSSGILTVVAGTGSEGYSGDGGQATDAQLIYPTAIAFDKNGNLYIVDESTQCVRMVNMASGIITTVAGIGNNWGYNGDNILAVNAYLYNPVAIAFDRANDFYISDHSNNRIRRVDGITGIITTIAGTDSTGYNRDSIPSDSAWLNGPYGITLDKSNNIYFVDQNNCRIRMIKASNDTIYTLSGGRAGYSGDGGPASKAKFWYPIGIAVDSVGNIYIGDTYDNRIREITIANDTIRTICGTGNGNFSGDGGAANSAEIFQPHYLAFNLSGDLFFGDMGNERVREIFSSNGTINSLCGTGMPGYNGNNILATTSQLSYPTDMASDSLGNIYVADNGNNMLRVIEASTGNILKVAGDGTAGGGGDGGPALKAQLNGIDGIALNDTGNVFVADENNHKIREVKIATNTIITCAGNGHKGYSGDGGFATTAELSYPVDVAFDKLKDMFIADMDNNRIREVFSISIYRHIKSVAGDGYNAGNGGGFSGDGAKATLAELNQPQGVAVDSTGNIYIADTWNDRIRKVDAATGFISTIAGNGVWGYTGDGGPATAAELGIPTGVKVDAAGNVYIADFYNNVVRRVNAWDNTIITLAGDGWQNFSGDGGPSSSAELDLTHNISFDLSGNLLIADYGNNRIRKFNATVGIPTVKGNGNLIAYPNPSSDVIYLNAGNFSSNNSELLITDVAGRTVIEKVINKLPITGPVEVNIASLSPGIYFVIVRNNDHQVCAKIVKE